MENKYLKAGYFIVYKTRNTFYHKLIVDTQKKAHLSSENIDYVHVEPIINDRWSVNSKLPKIRISDMFEMHKGEYCKIVKPKIENYGKYRKEVLIQCLTRVNLPYGLIGLFWFKLRKIFKRNFFAFFGDFCSELCGYGLWKIFVEQKNIDFAKIMPRRFDTLYPADFLDSRYFEIIWEGEIENLSKNKVDKWILFE
ncbi:MAG TPA: hypothetical protein ENI61_06660 [Ignavibacteria bacterium]|nr:hypothetical protein [Ignavibacteria bacterium]